MLFFFLAPVVYQDQVVCSHVGPDNLDSSSSECHRSPSVLHYSEALSLPE